MATISSIFSRRPAPIVVEFPWCRDLTSRQAVALGYSSIDPTTALPDPLLARLLPGNVAMGEQLLPWRRMGGATIVLCRDPGAVAHHLPGLTEALGPVRLAHAEKDALLASLTAIVGRRLATDAERRVPSLASCRSLPFRPLTITAGALDVTLLVMLALWPLILIAGVAVAAVAVLVLSTLLKASALLASLSPDRSDDGAEVVPARLPVITILVPLYHERAIAHTLIARMAALDYPRDLLDLCLVTEDDDAVTRAAIEAATIPSWAQVIEVPEGTLRTKPRALNYALGFARGSIVGIYDAEDVPAPDHLRRVASTFARRGPETACLQGALDYYNSRTNWLARCFTLEYAAWFRVILPGLARMGLVIPLGGTTLFLRREAIEAVGGWDAHNVTEDADLGVRLARAGYRTELIGITTMEEANARAWPWIKQRSRWLKGYAVTYAVHMRAPVRLWRDLGTKRFVAFQVQFLGTLAQFALAPLLWTFWFVPLGLTHPLSAMLTPGLLFAMAVTFLMAQTLDCCIAWLGMHRARRPGLALWAPILIAYFPLATIAIYRALWEVVVCPFRWDKTAHGIDAPVVVALPPQRVAFTGPRIGPAPQRAAAALLA